MFIAAMPVKNFLHILNPKMHFPYSCNPATRPVLREVNTVRILPSAPEFPTLHLPLKLHVQDKYEFFHFPLTFLCFSPRPHLSNHINSIKWRVHIMKLLIPPCTSVPTAVSSFLLDPRVLLNTFLPPSFSP